MSVYRTPVRRQASIAIAGLLIAGHALLGCTPAPTHCGAISGSYQALYTPVGGNCGPVQNPHRVPFDGGSNGVNTTIQKFANADVVTEIVMMGCTARMTQIVQEQGAVRSKIDGSPIDIEDANELRGTVTLTRYDGAGAVMCLGTYDATFTKNTSTIAAAAQ
jgi:hypothetical protein